jgi:DNA-binding NtrC family response regulator
VDDNESVVNVVETTLEYLGYRVTGFTEAQEALKVFSEKPSEFDLVITDYVMPNLTGEDIAQKMLRIRSDIPIILCTAYSNLISWEKAMAIGFRELILKPFNYREFAEIVRRVLDQKDPGNK